jgi:hypothetical protein
VTVARSSAQKLSFTASNSLTVPDGLTNLRPPVSHRQAPPAITLYLCQLNLRKGRIEAHTMQSEYIPTSYTRPSDYEPRFETFDEATSFEVILECTPLKRLAATVLGSAFEVLARPRSFVIRRPYESDDVVERIIVLPPHGCTANSPDELNPHPEVRRATITVHGALRASKRGFSRLKNLVQFNRFTTARVLIDENIPNARPDASNPHFKSDLRSAGQTFIAATEAGYGFYHNLVNTTPEWVVILVRKQLKLQKTMDLRVALGSLPTRERATCEMFMDAVARLGDEVFLEPTLRSALDAIAAGRPELYLPVLVGGLNIAETGKHEACTVYAMIMKIGRRQRSATIEYLAGALDRQDAPAYYLRELVKKLSS